MFQTPLNHNTRCYCLHARRQQFWFHWLNAHMWPNWKWRFFATRPDFAKQFQPSSGHAPCAIQLWSLVHVADAPPKVLPTKGTGRHFKFSLQTGCLILPDDRHPMIYTIWVTRENNCQLGTKSTRCKRERKLQHWICVVKNSRVFLNTGANLCTLHRLRKLVSKKLNAEKSETKTIANRNPTAIYACVFLHVFFPPPLFSCIESENSFVAGWH